MNNQFVWRNEMYLWVEMLESRSRGGIKIIISRNTSGQYGVRTTGTHHTISNARLYAAGIILAAEQADRLAKREQLNNDTVKVGDHVSFTKSGEMEIGTVIEVVHERFTHGVSIRYERDGLTKTRWLDMHEFEVALCVTVVPASAS